MKKAILAALVCLGLLLPGVGANGAEQTLHSKERAIIFQAGDYLKTIWMLQPELNPDVFTLPEYRTQQEVKFNTGTDSLSFLVGPGGTYNFTVELNDGERCRIAIVAPPTPVLLVEQRWMGVVAGFALVGLMAYCARRTVPLTPLLVCAWTAPLSFWALTILGGLIHGHYNPLRMVVSELGAIGTRSQFFMSMGELFVGVQCLLFSAGIHRASQERGLNILPAICTLGMPISMAWAAVFPMHHPWHGSLGPMPLLLNMGALLAFLLWRRPELARLRWLSLAAFAGMGLIFLRFVPSIQINFPGLVQRLYYAGWTFWSVCLGWTFLAGEVEELRSGQRVVRTGGLGEAETSPVQCGSVQRH